MFLYSLVQYILAFYKTRAALCNLPVSKWVENLFPLTPFPISYQSRVYFKSSKVPSDM
jgi:hypothetical protein